MKHLYRHPSHLPGAFIMGLLGGGVVLSTLFQTDEGDKIFVATLCLVGILALCGRLAWVGVAVMEDGIKVRNFFGSFSLKWSEIDRFEVGWWWLADVCVIHMVDGEQRRATAIYEGGLVPNGSAKEMVSSLNMELQQSR